MSTHFNEFLWRRRLETLLENREIAQNEQVLLFEQNVSFSFVRLYYRLDFYQTVFMTVFWRYVVCKQYLTLITSLIQSRCNDDVYKLCLRLFWDMNNFAEHFPMCYTMDIFGKYLTLSHIKQVSFRRHWQYLLNNNIETLYNNIETLYTIT